MGREVQENSLIGGREPDGGKLLIHKLNVVHSKSKKFVNGHCVVTQKKDKADGFWIDQFERA